MVYNWHAYGIDYRFMKDDTNSFRCSFDEQMSDQPLTREQLPECVVLTKGDGLMADIFEIQSGCTVVSEELRALLEHLAPKDVSFVEIDIELPQTMTRSARYYYMNILGRAQATCWARTTVEESIIPPGVKSLFGSKKQFELPASVTNSPTLDGWVMKRRRQNDPVIWRELRVELEDRVYSGATTRTFMTDGLYSAFSVKVQSEMCALPIREIDC